MRWYRANWVNEIRAVEVVRETDATVVVRRGQTGEFRERKRSDGHSYRRTWQQARSALIDMQRRALRVALERAKAAQAHVQFAKKRLDAAYDLHPPAEG